jgi:membrane protein
MYKGLGKGEVQTLPGLSRQLHIGYDDVERILEKLVKAKIVGKLSGSGWSMVRAPEAVELNELMKLFLLDVSTLPRHSGDGDIRAWFAALEKRMSEPKGMTFYDMWNKGA